MEVNQNFSLDAVAVLDSVGGSRSNQIALNGCSRISSPENESSNLSGSGSPNQTVVNVTQGMVDKGVFQSLNFRVLN